MKRGSLRCFAQSGFTGLLSGSFRPGPRPKMSGASQPSHPYLARYGNRTSTHARDRQAYGLPVFPAQVGRLHEDINHWRSAGCHPRCRSQIWNLACEPRSAGREAIDWQASQRPMAYVLRLWKANKWLQSRSNLALWRNRLIGKSAGCRHQRYKWGTTNNVALKELSIKKKSVIVKLFFWLFHRDHTILCLCAREVASSLRQFPFC